MKFFKVTLGIALIFVVAFFVVMFLSKKDTTDGPVACTEEAMLCPDGSYVGRTGPSCQFAACPPITEPVVPPENTADVWDTSTNTSSGISFSYPAALMAQYIHPVEWPPQVEVLAEAYSCKESGSAVLPEGQTKQKTIQNTSYCVTEESEGAAGTIYTKYSYQFAEATQTVKLSFTLKAVQCANYDEPQKTACESERASFDIDALSDKIAKTIRVE
jgi:hypothetical protein